MSSTTYNWFTINDHDDLTGDGMVSVGIVPSNTGRNGRSADIELTTPSNASAAIVVEQDGADEFIDISCFEDNNGNEILTLPANGGICNIVGVSNCGYLNAVEISTKEYTDINSNSGMLHQGGFVLYENKGDGALHINIPIAASITPDYGLACAYMFKMPFYIEASETSDANTISVRVSNQGGTVTDEATITQSGS